MKRCDYCGEPNFIDTDASKTKCKVCNKILEEKPVKWNEKSIDSGGRLTPKAKMLDQEPWDD